MKWITSKLILLYYMKTIVGGIIQKLTPQKLTQKKLRKKEREGKKQKNRNN